jgi:hypothetical protein
VCIEAWPADARIAGCAVLDSARLVCYGVAQAESAHRPGEYILAGAGFLPGIPYDMIGSQRRLPMRDCRAMQVRL